MIGAIAPTAVVTLKPVGAERFSVYGPLTAFGGYRVSGLRGQNNTGTPDTQFDMSADLVQLWNPSNHAITIRTATGTLTNNISTAGPAANGRDQAGAFSAESWLHVYFIWNGTTLATISSTTAPPTGPTLPTGYTHWAYAGAVRYNATPLLVATAWRGSTAFYAAPRSQGVLSDGDATTATEVVLAAYMPPNALTARWSMACYLDALATGVYYCSIGLTSGVTGGGNAWVALEMASQIDEAALFSRFAEAPVIGQSVWYLNSASGMSSYIYVEGFTMPNGDV